MGRTARGRAARQRRVPMPLGARRGSPRPVAAPASSWAPARRSSCRCRRPRPSSCSTSTIPPTSRPALLASTRASCSCGGPRSRAAACCCCPPRPRRRAGGAPTTISSPGARPDVGPWPEIVTGDTRGILRNHPLTLPLTRAIEDTARAGGKTALIVTRRAATLLCVECGHVLRCPDCGVALPYSRKEGLLRCPLCARAEPLPERCPGCGGHRLGPLGWDAERIEASVRRRFPKLTVSRTRPAIPDPDRPAGPPAGASAREPRRRGHRRARQRARRR